MHFAAVLTACGASPNGVVSNSDSPQIGSTGTAVTNNQLPINERFASLDDYLAFLEGTQAPVDGPWYRQVSPGLYELQTGGNLMLEGGDPPKRTFTREELERKFGFRK